ncbi:MAG: hypothetical protein ABS917_11440 [Solibacillus sp.]|uniref:hypothetical protein n=1 Tax=Solibacillus sp. TaxID=1909654 RepID=UPI003315717B
MILIFVLIIYALITYFWTIGSHFYIDISRNYASSSFPGDITSSDRVFYQIFFPSTLFVFLLFATFILSLIFENKLKTLSFKKKFIYIISIPLLYTAYIFIDLYNFL